MNAKYILIAEAGMRFKIAQQDNERSLLKLLLRSFHMNRNV